MKRRQFLKSVFGVAAGLAVAPSVVKAHTNTVAEIKAVAEFESNAWWNIKGCKDCYRECVHFDDCMFELQQRERMRIEAAEKAANPLMIISPNVDISDLNIRPGSIQLYPLGTKIETGFGLSRRTCRYCKCV